MRFLHLSDLHIGKTLYGRSLLDDQRHILGGIVRLLVERAPDAVVIAGDIYDKYTPGSEAINLLDWFLTELAGVRIPALIIAGNHDNPRLIDYGGTFFGKNNIHICGAFSGEPKTFACTDEHGAVVFHLLPYIKPSTVNDAIPEAKCADYGEAVAAALAGIDFDDGGRHVLVSHQFYDTAEKTAATSDSEQLTVGGLDRIDAAALAGFDYAALGHLHRPQHVGAAGNVYYSGSPLKYSASECGGAKSANLVTLGAKGDVSVELIPLEPLHDSARLRGTLAEITSPENCAAHQDDYVYAVLTDEVEPADPASLLRHCFPLFLTLQFDNSRTQAANGAALPFDGKEVNLNDADELFRLFAEHFKNYHGRDMTDDEMKEAAARLAGGESAGGGE
jgi:exonuclease SbcD